MNIQRKLQLNEITEPFDDVNYLSYLSGQVENLEQALWSYKEHIKLRNIKMYRKVSKLDSLILDFMFSQKDNKTLSQAHIDDLDLISELIMIHYSEQTS
jgi:hypothetical protein